MPHQRLNYHGPGSIVLVLLVDAVLGFRWRGSFVRSESSGHGIVRPRPQTSHSIALKIDSDVHVPIPIWLLTFSTRKKAESKEGSSKGQQEARLKGEESLSSTIGMRAFSVEEEGSSLFPMVEPNSSLWLRRLVLPRRSSCFRSLKLVGSSQLLTEPRSRSDAGGKFVPEPRFYGFVLWIWIPLAIL